MMLLLRNRFIPGRYTVFPYDLNVLVFTHAYNNTVHSILYPLVHQASTYLNPVSVRSTYGYSNNSLVLKI